MLNLFLRFERLGWRLLCSADVSGVVHGRREGSGDNKRTRYYRENPHNWFFIKVDDNVASSEENKVDHKPQHYDEYKIINEKPPQYDDEAYF